VFHEVQSLKDGAISFKKGIAGLVAFAVAVLAGAVAGNIGTPENWQSYWQ